MQWGDTITITKAENGFILEEEGVLLDGEEVRIRPPDHQLTVPDHHPVRRPQV